MDEGIPSTSTGIYRSTSTRVRHLQLASMNVSSKDNETVNKNSDSSSFVEYMDIDPESLQKTDSWTNSKGTTNTVSRVKTVSTPHRKHLTEIESVTSPSKRKCSNLSFDATLESPSKKKKTSKGLSVTFDSNVRNVKRRLLPELQEKTLPEINKKIDIFIEKIENGGDSLDVLDELRLHFENLNKQAKMNKIHLDKLLKLFNLLKSNVQGGVPDVVVLNRSAGGDKNIRRAQTKMQIEHIIGAADACSICLNIMTAPNMPSRVYLGEIIDEIVSYLNFHVSHTVFCLDPIYKREKSNVLKKIVANVIPEDTLLVIRDKITNVINLLGSLLNMKLISETSALDIFTFGISTLFVENIKEMQLAFIELLTKIFIMYESSHNLLLDVFDRVVHLPKNRQNLRIYTLQNKAHIQMLTALILRIIQDGVGYKRDFSETNHSATSIQKSFRKAEEVAYEIIKCFCEKCFFKNDNAKYEALFQNFLRDIINALCNPEFPAAELLLYLVGSVFGFILNERKMKSSVRVTVLNCLGFIATSVRKQNVLLVAQSSTIDEIIEKVKRLQNVKAHNDDDKLDLIKNIFFEYFVNEIRDNDSLVHTYYFYVAFWNREQNRKIVALNEAKRGKQNKLPFRKSFERSQEILVTSNDSSSLADAAITKKEAEVIIKYVAYEHCLNDTFDVYFKTILDNLRDLSATMRLKALKCLTEIVEIDTTLFEKNYVRASLEYCFNDDSTLVREHSIDLIGKFILKKKNLLDHHYGMLMKKIADPVPSIRISIIKIFKNVCVQYPNYSKVPEIFNCIIKRIDDKEMEETVVDVLKNLWFKTNTKITIVQRVSQMDNIIRSRSGTELFKQLLNKITKPKKREVYKDIGPSKQILATLDQTINFVLKNTSGGIDGIERKEKLLYLFAQVYPQAFAPHITQLWEYLNLKLKSPENVDAITYTIRTIESTLPVIEDIDNNLLTQLERRLIHLVTKYYVTTELDLSCLRCLKTIVDLTKDFKVIECLYNHKFSMIAVFKNLQMQNHPLIQNEKYKSHLVKMVPMIGELIKLFDFNQSIDDVLDVVLFFLNYTDLEIKLSALKAIGSICLKYNDLMSRNEVVSFYEKALSEPDFHVQLKSEVLINIEEYILEKEKYIVSLGSRVQQDNKWSSIQDVINLYLENILKSYFDKDNNIRCIVSRIVFFITKKAYINPVQVVAYFICMTTDYDPECSTKSQQILQEINDNYSNFINTKVLPGMLMSFDLQKILQSEEHTPRGFYRDDETGNNVSLNGHLYSLLSSNQQRRCALIQQILNQFVDEKNADLSRMIYMADNLAYFPYKYENEVLFIIHEIDKIFSLFGTNLVKYLEENLVNDKDKTDITDNESIQIYVTALQGCYLLHLLKEFLIQRFGFNQRQLSNNSFTDVKKSALKIKNNGSFRPSDVIDRLKQNNSFEREGLVEDFLNIKSALEIDEIVDSEGVENAE